MATVTASLFSALDGVVDKLQSGNLRASIGFELNQVFRGHDDSFSQVRPVFSGVASTV